MITSEVPVCRVSLGSDNTTRSVVKAWHNVTGGRLEDVYAVTHVDENVYSISEVLRSPLMERHIVSGGKMVSWINHVWFSIDVVRQARAHVVLDQPPSVDKLPWSNEHLFAWPGEEMWSCEAAEAFVRFGNSRPIQTWNSLQYLLGIVYRRGAPTALDSTRLATLHLPTPTPPLWESINTVMHLLVQDVSDACLTAHTDTNPLLSEETATEFLADEFPLNYRLFFYQYEKDTGQLKLGVNLFALYLVTMQTYASTGVNEDLNYICLKAMARKVFASVACKLPTNYFTAEAGGEDFGVLFGSIQLLLDLSSQTNAELITDLEFPRLHSASTSWLSSLCNVYFVLLRWPVNNPAGQEVHVSFSINRSTLVQDGEVITRGGNDGTTNTSIYTFPMDEVISRPRDNGIALANTSMHVMADIVLKDTSVSFQWSHPSKVHFVDEPTPTMSELDIPYYRITRISNYSRGMFLREAIRFAVTINFARSSNSSNNNNSSNPLVRSDTLAGPSGATSAGPVSNLEAINDALLEDGLIPALKRRRTKKKKDDEKKKEKNREEDLHDS